MFTHILIPTDLTDRTKPTLALAVKMPRTSSAHFTLLHVVQTISAGSFDEFESFYGKQDTPVRAVSKISQETLAEMVGPTRSRVIRGATP